MKRMHQSCSVQGESYNDLQIVFESKVFSINLCLKVIFNSMIKFICQLLY